MCIGYKGRPGKGILLQFLLVFCIAFPCLAIAQSANEVKEMQVKAAYLYNFTKFVYWESPEGESQPASITIGFYHADLIADFLEKFVASSVQKPAIIIKRIANLDEGFSDCQLLYIDQSQKNDLPQILQRIKGSKVLTIGDMSGFAHKGGMIGFYLEDGRLKIEIDLTEVNNAGLKLSAKLIEVARIVK